jgi:hypothetical protein
MTAITHERFHKAALAPETSWPCARGGCAAMIEYGRLTALGAIMDILPKNMRDAKNHQTAPQT